MDIAIPLTLEAVRLVLQTLPEKYNGTPEDLYNFFFFFITKNHIRTSISPVTGSTTLRLRLL